MKLDEFTLTDAERERFLKAAMRDEKPDAAVGWVNRVLRKKPILPEEVQKSLKDLSIQDSDTDLVVLRNIPIPKDLPPTPGFFERMEDEQEQELQDFSDSVLGKISEFMGLEGIVSSRIGSASTNGIAQELRLHHDPIKDSEERPFVFLACWRGNEQAVSRVAKLEEILNPLSDREIELLQREVFHGKEEMGKEREKTLGPVLEVREHGAINFSYSASSFLNELEVLKGADDELECAQALEKIVKALENAACVEFVLEEGDLLIMSNDDMHGRTEYTQKQEPGQRRWLELAHPRVKSEEQGMSKT